MYYLYQTSLLFLAVQLTLFVYSGGFDYEASRRLFWLLISIFFYSVSSNIAIVRRIMDRIIQLEMKIDEKVEMNMKITDFFPHLGGKIGNEE